jgi:hypothetical protein
MGKLALLATDSSQKVQTSNIILQHNNSQGTRSAGRNSMIFGEKNEVFYNKVQVKLPEPASAVKQCYVGYES